MGVIIYPFKVNRVSKRTPCFCPSTMSPDSKVHGANMGPIWGRQDPGGPHVGPMKIGQPRDI